MHIICVSDEKSGLHILWLGTLVDGHRSTSSLVQATGAAARDIVQPDKEKSFRFVIYPLCSLIDKIDVLMMMNSKLVQYNLLSLSLSLDFLFF